VRSILSARFRRPSDWLTLYFCRPPFRFACLTATFVHAVLYYRGVVRPRKTHIPPTQTADSLWPGEIWTQARRQLRDETDIHARLMRRYQEVRRCLVTVLGRRAASLTVFSHPRSRNGGTLRASSSTSRLVNL
jgi:hypothetical protein